MGRKGIGPRRKSGKLGSFTPSQKRYSFRPNEVRSGIFQRPTCPKLKAVIVGEERYIFGESTDDASTSLNSEVGGDGDDEEQALQDKPMLKQPSILKAIFQSGGTEEERAVALMAALKDVSLHSILKSVVMDLTSSSSEKTPIFRSSIASTPAQQEPATAMLDLPAPQVLFPNMAR
jgi:hypothetical protein